MVVVILSGEMGGQQYHRALGIDAGRLGNVLAGTMPQSWRDVALSTEQCTVWRSVASLQFNCPDDPFVTSSDQARFLNADESGTYVRLTFAAPLVSYDDALATIDNLGLRLADPCYEGGLAHVIPWLWHPMDQTASFAARHVLVVATTLYASTTWHDQLQATHGVATVQASAATACA